VLIHVLTGSGQLAAELDAPPGVVGFAVRDRVVRIVTETAALAAKAGQVTAAARAAEPNDPVA
jgi:hypothetical protein